MSPGPDGALAGFCEVHPTLRTTYSLGDAVVMTLMAGAAAELAFGYESGKELPPGDAEMVFDIMQRQISAVPEHQRGARAERVSAHFGIYLRRETKEIIERYCEVIHDIAQVLVAKRTIYRAEFLRLFDEAFDAQCRRYGDIAA